MRRLLIFSILIVLFVSADVLYFNAPFFGIFFIPISLLLRGVAMNNELSKSLLFLLGLVVITLSISAGWYRDKLIIYSVKNNVIYLNEYRAKNGFYPEYFLGLEGMDGKKMGVNRIRILCKNISYYHKASSKYSQEVAFISYRAYGEQGNVVFDLMKSSLFLDMP